MPFIKVPIYRKHRLEKDDSIILEDQMILTLEISNKLLEKLLLSTDEAKREINHFATMQATKDIYYSAEEKERLSELTKKHGILKIEIGLDGEIEVIHKPIIN